MKQLTTPLTEEAVSRLKTGERVLLSGKIYTARDAAIPKLVELIKEDRLGDLDLQGQVIFHTAVSPAGVGPTSSNKLEIESSIGPLSKAGIRLHLGKGALHKETIEALNEFGSVYAVIPPVTALLGDKTLEEKTVAFPEEGMEALHMLQVDGYPAIIAAAHGRSIYDD